MTMKKQAAKSFLVCAILLMTTGCMSVGHRFPTDNVSRIKIGETTRSDVRRMFGSPWRTGMEDGQPTWTYGHYRYSLFSEAGTEDLVIRFDDVGVVSSYSFNTTEE